MIFVTLHTNLNLNPNPNLKVIESRKVIALKSVILYFENVHFLEKLTQKLGIKKWRSAVNQLNQFKIQSKFNQSFFCQRKYEQ